MSLDRRTVNLPISIGDTSSIDVLIQNGEIARNGSLIIHSGRFLAGKIAGTVEGLVLTPNTSFVSMLGKITLTNPRHSLIINQRIGREQYAQMVGMLTGRIVQNELPVPREQPRMPAPEMDTQISPVPSPTYRQPQRETPRVGAQSQQASQPEARFLPRDAPPQAKEESKPTLPVIGQAEEPEEKKKRNGRCGSRPVSSH